MALSYLVALRNAMLQNIQTTLDAQTAAGVLNIYSGTRPATGAALSGNTLLATLAVQQAKAMVDRTASPIETGSDTVEKADALKNVGGTLLGHVLHSALDAHLGPGMGAAARHRMRHRAR